MKRTTMYGLLGILTGIFLFSCATGAEVSPSGGNRSVPAGTDPFSLQQSFRDVASQSLPSVVLIDVEQIRRQTIPDGSDVPWFDFFFGEPDQDNGEEREFRTQGLGSGIIVRHDGEAYYVLTNAHVLGEAESITITLDDGTKYPAELQGSDERKDLALLKVTTDDALSVARLGDSGTLQVGDWVLAIGSPFGFQSTVTAGIVSALGRRGGPDGNISDFIQTDAAINRGNSGGALVNLAGEVVGINTWISSQTGGSVGLGFSIPINNAVKAIDDFITTGSVRYGWLGVSIRSVTPEMAQSLQLSNRRGALVHHVFRNSPADRGGLLPGDFITSINDTPVNDSDELILLVGDLPVGERAHFEITRYGNAEAVDVTIAERGSDREISEQNSFLWPGFSVFPLTDEIRLELGVSSDLSGLFITSVESRTPASAAGFTVGDIVTAVNGTPVPSMVDFFRELNNADGAVSFSINREGTQITITLEG